MKKNYILIGEGLPLVEGTVEATARIVKKRGQYEQYKRKRGYIIFSQLV